MAEQRTAPPQDPRTNTVVFGITGALVACFLGWALASPTALSAFAEAALNWAVDDIGWASCWPRPDSWCSDVWLAFSR